MESDVQTTIEMVGRILATKTLKSLMRSYLQEIPRLFGFEHCAVMFHDDEQDTLYQITFGDDQEQQLESDAKIAKATTDQERAYLRVLHSMNDAMVPAKGLIRFPKTTGITGKVFATQKPIFFNNANVGSNYLF
jgi:transcriptional regulator with GAF, ATPase, and Fis domain